jgi:hypothetical protein
MSTRETLSKEIINGHLSTLTEQKEQKKASSTATVLWGTLYIHALAAAAAAAEAEAKQEEEILLQLRRQSKNLKWRRRVSSCCCWRKEKAHISGF